MRYLAALLWLCVSACWLLPIWSVCNVVGDCKWIAHMGQSGSVAVTAAMFCLCVAAAAGDAVSGRVSRLIAIPIIVGSIIHLLRAAVFFNLTSSNGHVSPIVLLPFQLLGAAAPTVLAADRWSTMLALYVGLPIVSLLLAIVPAARRLPPTRQSTGV